MKKKKRLGLIFDDFRPQGINDLSVSTRSIWCVASVRQAARPLTAEFDFLASSASLKYIRRHWIYATVIERIESLGRP